MNKVTTYIIPPRRHSNSHTDRIQHQLDTIPPPPPSSSPPTSFYMPMYPPTSTTSTPTMNGDGPLPSSTPVLSSSASTTSTTSFTSYSSTRSSHDEDDSILPHEHFYSHLQTHSSLLRIVLRRSLPVTLISDQWHRLKLEVRDEFGMALEGQRAKAFTMHLACELLEQSTTGRRNHAVYLSTNWKVGWRPLHYDPWESMENVSQKLTCSGFDRSGTGGLEFIITRQQQHNGNDHPDNNNNSSAPPTITTLPPDNDAAVVPPATQFYLRVVPTFEPHQAIHALPLVVGPFSMIPATNWTETTTTTTTTTTMDHHTLGMVQQQGKEANTSSSSSSSSSPQLCNVNCYSRNMYRAFNLNGMNRYFMIKEGWDLGTPGKMWDSALMISDLFIQKIIQQPTCLENCHLLDLSAGTGAIGLLISFFYKHMFPEYHQNMKTTLTDLPEALPLIHYNQQLNGIATTKDISVASLCWGEIKDMWRIKKEAPIDIIIASDVLYEPMQFAALMETLIYLAEPDRTVIYLGYKRRGLKASDEQYFFTLCRDAFDMQAVGYDNNNNDDDDETVVVGGDGDDNDMEFGADNDNLDIDGKDGSVGGYGTIDRQSKKSDGDKVGWEKHYGKLVRNGSRINGEGWLGSYAKKWQADSQDNNKNSNSDMVTQAIEETGVQIYRLVRKRQIQ